MLKKNAIVEIENDKWYDNIDVIRIYKNKKVYLIIGGKEVFIKLMNIPKVKNDELNKIIENEVKYYLKSLDETLFSYCVYRENDINIEILLYCINWCKTYMISKFIKNGFTLKVINPIQIVFINYFNKIIDENKYMLIFEFNNKMYFIGILHKKMICNSVYDGKLMYDDFEKNFKEFKDKADNFEENEIFTKIYFLDFCNKELIKHISSSYSCKDLGTTNKEIILNSIMQRKYKM